MRWTLRTYRHFSLAAILVFSASSASAQKATIQTAPSSMTLRSSLLMPLASSSFAPLSFGGTFNGSVVKIGLGSVSLNSLADPVLLEMSSSISVGTPQGIANGNYSVVITVPWSNQVMNLQAVRGATELASCSLQQQVSYAAGAPVQQCEMGPFAVTEGNLNVIVRIKNPNPTCQTCVAWSQQINVSQITLNLWK